MDEDSLDEKPTVSGNSRHRNPVFSKEEVKLLLKLIEKYKTVILNKCTSTSAIVSKEAVWNKITNTFNKHHLKTERSAESLKIKWDNLKKDARKLSKNLMDINYDEIDDVTSKIVALICESENNPGTGEKLQDADIDLNEVEEGTNDSYKKTEDEEENDSDDNECDSSDRNSKVINRSMNFSPEECSLLVQCVKQEKKYVFDKVNTAFANKLKDRAWNRISNTYNRLSPQKRSTKVLRTKFSNMKRMAKTINFKDYIKDAKRKSERVGEDSGKMSVEIKAEPVFEYKVNFERENDDIIDDEPSDMQDEKSNHNHNMDFVPDPLSTVLYSDSGIESINNSENKEVVKLQIELLNYKMETAKLERKRIEDAIEADELHTSLKLRAARLEAVAAAIKLPAAHAALAFPAREARAQLYLQHHHHT